VLSFFDDTRADKPVRIENKLGVLEETFGWRFEHMPPPYLTEPTATARTVRSLALINRMLEFDPVLWKRKPSGDRPSSIFAFLTASMLPKLKTLHKTAAKRSVAYVLITNLISSLDEPTVREGRFDKKLGIYPPDLQSPAGRFLSEADAILSEKYKPEVFPNDKDAQDRLKDIIGEISSGAGMEGLTQEGYFRRPANKESPKEGTPLQYYISGDAKEKPQRLEPDAVLTKVNGEGPHAVREYQEWAWVDTWDTKFKNKGFQALEEPPVQLLSRHVLWVSVWSRKIKTLFTRSLT
jgi:hypothetical protein